MPKTLSETMLDRYGPLIGGADLRKALGFRSAASFQRAVRTNGLGVRVFCVPGRRGKFALTIEVAQWLALMSASDNAAADGGAHEAQSHD